MNPRNVLPPANTGGGWQAAGLPAIAHESKLEIFLPAPFPPPITHPPPPRPVTGTAHGSGSLRVEAPNLSQRAQR